MTDKLAGVRPELRAKVEELIRRAALEGLPPVLVIDGARSPGRQAELYAQGRTRPGRIVTWERDSPHEHGAAVDVVFLVDGRPSWDASLPWARLGELGEGLDLFWGGRWREHDDGHFELVGWHDLPPVA